MTTAQFITAIEAKPHFIKWAQVPQMAEKIKGIVSVALAEKTAQVIRQTKEEEARTAITTSRTAIEGAMVVTIV